MRVKISSEESPQDHRVRHEIQLIQTHVGAEQVIASRTSDTLADAARKAHRTLLDQAAEAERLFRAMGLWSEPVAQTLDAPMEQSVAPRVRR